MKAPDIFLPDDAATARFGAELAASLKPGDLVTLKGDLGAGKSALARAIIRTLLANPHMDVPSPSFALVQPYETGGLTVLHADLYRLSGPDEIEELGLFDSPQAIVLVEWPERAPDLTDRADVAVHLCVPKGGQGRYLHLMRKADQRSL